MTGLIDRLDGRVDDMPLAAYHYLRFLEKRGYVECRLDDRRLITDVVVLADASYPPGSEGAILPKAGGVLEPRPGVERTRREEEWAGILR